MSDASNPLDPTNQAPAEETPATEGIPAADPRLASVMATPPPPDMVPGHRVMSAQNEVDLATPPAGSPPPAPQVNSRQFAAFSPAPNEFKISHQGKDLGGKVLTPTEVPIVLGWLNSLPPD